MSRLYWGALILLMLAPFAPPDRGCVEELWIIPEPTDAHYVCAPGAVLIVEPHVVRCRCELNPIVLTRR